jgi:hypothetical protein
MKKPPDDYKTIKLNISHVVRPSNEDVFRKICNETVQRMHTITREAMFFLKVLVLENPGDIVEHIDVNFLDTLMQSICIQPATGRKPKKNKDLKAYLIQAYEEKMLPLHPVEFQHSRPTYTHLNTCLDYAAESWMTMIENNIKQHFTDYVEKYVNFHLNKKETLEHIDTLKINKTEKDKLKEAMAKRCRTVMKYLLQLEQTEKMLNHPDYEWISVHKSIVLPDKQVYQENSIPYDIQCEPIPYLLPMIRMMKSIEDSKKADDDKPKLSNCLPTRPSLIPTHTRIDTTTLAYLTKRFDDEKLKADLHMIWTDYLLTGKKVFKKRKGYRFNDSILTDGISCCLLMVKEELYGKRYKKKKKVKIEEPYIHELPEDGLKSFDKREIVGIDPNMGNLLFCMGSEGKRLRYTNSQRRVECKKKKFDAYNEERFGECIDGKTVKEWETLLSDFDSKTLDGDFYKRYLQERFRVDEQLKKFYSRDCFRKLSLHSFMNRRNSELKFMKKFMNKYGNKDEAIVCIGDWEQLKHRKFKEPVKGKGFRKMFRDHGYRVYLVDEFRTSKQCSGCKREGATLEKFYRRKYVTKGGKQKTSELLHGLLKCTTCKKLWNRDVNASRNQREIATSLIAGNGRPHYLQRKKVTQTSNPV